jgi:hypothetical protein
MVLLVHYNYNCILSGPNRSIRTLERPNGSITRLERPNDSIRTLQPENGLIERTLQPENGLMILLEHYNLSVPEWP